MTLSGSPIETLATEPMADDDADADEATGPSSAAKAALLEVNVGQLAQELVDKVRSFTDVDDLLKGVAVFRQRLSGLRTGAAMASALHSFCGSLLTTR